jgi:hypothetical protein
MAPACHPRDRQLHRHARRLGQVALAAEHQRLDRHLELQVPSLPGAQPQAGKVEVVGFARDLPSG